MKGRALVLGKGNCDLIKIDLKGAPDDGPPRNFYDVFAEVVSIDIDPASNPTYVHDLDKFPWPVPTRYFDEVHAYEVLEHLGGLGDWQSFFALWREIWRVTKPGGYVCATTPWWESVWAWQDPGHRRVYSTELLTYLNQGEYTKQVGVTALTDYRRVWPEPYSFKLMLSGMSGEDPKRAGFYFVLQREGEGDAG